MIRIRRLLRGSSPGVTLIEALIAMAIVGIIAAAFLGGLATAARSAALADIRTNAESLARTHLEYAKSQQYIEPMWDYEVTDSPSGSPPENRPDWWDTNPPPLLSADYAGYRVLVEAMGVPEDPGDPQSEILEGIQEIRVRVFYPQMYDDDPVITLSGYKVDR